MLFKAIWFTSDCKLSPLYPPNPAPHPPTPSPPPPCPGQRAGLSESAYKTQPLRQQSPTFWAPGTSFMEDLRRKTWGGVWRRGWFQGNSSALQASSPPAVQPGSQWYLPVSCPEVGDLCFKAPLDWKPGEPNSNGSHARNVKQAEPFQDTQNMKK